jgi:hypothetical protein
LCCELIFRSLSDGVIEEIELENGQVVNSQWIQHTFDFDSFCIFGFLDDFAMPTAQPGGLATRLYGFMVDIQRSFYSGYLRDHGYKAQVVFLPIGLLGSIFITEIRQNDNGVQNMSGLNDYLIQLLRGRLIGGDSHAFMSMVYFDISLQFSQGTSILQVKSRTSISKWHLNVKRQFIEHCFGDHRTKFKLFSMPHSLRIFSDGEKIRKQCLLSFFMLNCYYCLDGTRAAYFGHHVPSLAEYLPLDEVMHPPPAVNLGDIFDFHNVL